MAAQPRRQIHLRITSTLLSKSRVVARYRQEGVIAPNEVCLIAIGAGEFGAYAAGLDRPLALSAVFPIGDEYVTLDRGTGRVLEQGVRLSMTISRARGDVDRTAFLDPAYSHVSGLIWSRVGIGNMSRKARPISLIHNPLAASPMPQQWGVWDREFVASLQEDRWEVADILAAADRTS